MTKIDINKIRVDGGTQSRKQVYEDTVTSYTELMIEGVVFKGVDVFDDGKDIWLANGFHRYHAHKRAGYKTIECNVITGTKRDAWIFSRSANSDHGLPRTIEEKRDIVISVLEDIEYAESSDRQIAKICNVSAMTVGRVRKALELNKKAKLPPPPAPKKSISATKSEAPEVHTEDDKLNEMKSEMEFIAEENAKLKDKLAVINMNSDDEAQVQVAATIEELRAQVKDLEIQLKAVTMSRNDFQNKCAEAIKQVSYWKKRAEKAEK